ncbi:MAG: MFS transporter [Gemmatimonadetes bacterium]|nr:MFS transporter [Gemmatimonadota bacterium]
MSDAGDRVGFRSLLRGNVLVLSLVSLLNDTASEMIFPLLPLFLVGTLGAGPAVLGLIEGVAESTSSIVKLLGGWLSDRMGRRRPLVAAGYTIAALGRPLIGLATAPWQVLAVRFTDRIGKGVRTAPRDALLAESVDPRHRGAAFGLHRSADHLGAVIGPLLASGLLLLMPGRLRTIFLLAAIPGVATALLATFAVRETKPVASSAPGESLGLRALGPSFTRYLGVVVLFTLGNASDAFLLLRASDLGVSTPLLLILWVALHVSKSSSSLFGGSLADRKGPLRPILAGWLLYALMYAGFALASSTWHVWVLFLVYGVHHGLTETPEKALVARMAPAALRGRAFGAYHFAIGVAALSASLGFGLLWQVRGAPAAFFVGAALALVAAALLPLVVRGGLGEAPA